MALYETQLIDLICLCQIEINWIPDQVRHDILK